MSEQPTPERAQRLRTLLPTQPQRSPSLTKADYVRIQRPGSVAAACKECRKQKAKCSGERPACRRCDQRRVQCHYTTQPGERQSDAFKRHFNNLQRRATAHEELVELLRNRPDQEAQDIFQRIRSGADIKTILNQVKTGDLLLQMAVEPETRFRYEFPYKSEFPEDYFINNPYLTSLIYEATSLYSTGHDSNYSPLPKTERLANLGSSEYQSVYLKPFHAAQVVDPLLSNVKVSLWTAVCDDDDLMRDLLGVFFRCEYHFTAAFQKDLFLEDMATQQHDFCSSLLVNIMLAYSCVCYPRFSNRAEYWNPNTLVYKFLAEAKRIWELEATEARLTTVQAGILFNVFHNLCGLDEIGQAYRINSIALAHKLRLFDSSLDGSDRIRKGRAYTAWALYDWETLVGFSFLFPPLLNEPPDWPLPDPSVDAHFYGEIWVKYPLTHSLSPSYFGHVFKARSEFRIIMNAFCQAAFSKGSEMNLHIANGLLARLQDWYNGLPGPLLSTTIVLPGQLQLHMYYYHLILLIYEPLLDAKTNQEPSPQQIVSDAQRYLQTLIRLYFLRHGYEAMDLFIVVPFMLAGSKCIDDISEQVPGPKLEALRSTLILIAQGLYHQRRNHYLAEVLFRVIRGQMRQDEFSLLKNSMRIDDEEDIERRHLAQAVRSHWPVSVVKKSEDMESYILKNLVETYAQLNVDANTPTTEDSR